MAETGESKNQKGTKGVCLTPFVAMGICLPRCGKALHRRSAFRIESVFAA